MTRVFGAGGPSSAAVRATTRRRAVEQLRGVQGQIAALNRDLTTQLRQARVATVPGLTAEGLTTYRAQLAAQITAQYQPRIDQLRAAITSDTATVSQWAKEHRPALPEDAVGLQRTQARWDGVRMQLDAGISIRQIVAHADLEEAIAIREWAPAWIKASMFAGAAPGLDGTHTRPDLDGFRRVVDSRIIELTGGEAHDALTAEREATAAQAAATPLLAHADNLLRAGTGGQEPDSLGPAMAAAIGARLASQPADAATTNTNQAKQ